MIRSNAISDEAFATCICQRDLAVVLLALQQRFLCYLANGQPSQVDVDPSSLAKLLRKAGDVFKYLRAQLEHQQPSINHDFESVIDNHCIACAGTVSFCYMTLNGILTENR